jgi:hypothetical protein
MNKYYSFLALWKTYKDAITAGNALSDQEQQPAKKPRVAGLTESRSAYLKSQLDAAVKQVERSLGDEYE